MWDRSESGGLPPHPSLRVELELADPPHPTSLTGENAHGRKMQLRQNPKNAERHKRQLAVLLRIVVGPFQNPPPYPPFSGVKG